MTQPQAGGYLTIRCQKAAYKNCHHYAFIHAKKTLRVHSLLGKKCGKESSSSWPSFPSGGGRGTGVYAAPPEDAILCTKDHRELFPESSLAFSAEVPFFF